MSPAVDRSFFTMALLLSTLSGTARPLAGDEAETYVPAPAVAAEASIPLFEAGFGSTSTIVKGAVTIGTTRVSRESAIEGVFEYGRKMWERLEAAADALEADAVSLSIVRQAAKSPSFKDLSQAGSWAIAVALDRLSGDRRPLWLYFLQHATHIRPAEGQETVEGATNAWRTWGFQAGLL